jgi:hypothetical protein
MSTGNAVDDSSSTTQQQTQPHTTDSAHQPTNSGYIPIIRGGGSGQPSTSRSLSRPGCVSLIETLERERREATTARLKELGVLTTPLGSLPDYRRGTGDVQTVGTTTTATGTTRPLPKALRPKEPCRPPRPIVTASAAPFPVFSSIGNGDGAHLSTGVNIADSVQRQRRSSFSDYQRSATGSWRKPELDYRNPIPSASEQPVDASRATVAAAPYGRPEVAQIRRPEVVVVYKAEVVGGLGRRDQDSVKTGSVGRRCIVQEPNPGLEMLRKLCEEKAEMKKDDDKEQQDDLSATSRSPVVLRRTQQQKNPENATKRMSFADSRSFLSAFSTNDNGSKNQRSPLGMTSETETNHSASSGRHGYAPMPPAAKMSKFRAFSSYAADDSDDVVDRCESPAAAATVVRQKDPTHSYATMTSSLLRKPAVVSSDESGRRTTTSPRSWWTAYSEPEVVSSAVYTSKLSPKAPTMTSSTSPTPAFAHHVTVPEVTPPATSPVGWYDPIPVSPRPVIRSPRSSGVHLDDDDIQTSGSCSSSLPASGRKFVYPWNSERSAAGVSLQQLSPRLHPTTSTSDDDAFQVSPSRQSITISGLEVFADNAPSKPSSTLVPNNKDVDEDDVRSAPELPRHAPPPVPMSLPPPGDFRCSNGGSYEADTEDYEPSHRQTTTIDDNDAVGDLGGGSRGSGSGSVAATLTPTGGGGWYERLQQLHCIQHRPSDSNLTTDSGFGRSELDCFSGHDSSADELDDSSRSSSTATASAAGVDQSSKDVGIVGLLYDGQSPTSTPHPQCETAPMTPPSSLTFGGDTRMTSTEPPSTTDLRSSCAVAAVPGGGFLHQLLAENRATLTSLMSTRNHSDWTSTSGEAADEAFSDDTPTLQQQKQFSECGGTVMPDDIEEIAETTYPQPLSSSSPYTSGHCSSQSGISVSPASSESTGNSRPQRSSPVDVCSSAGQVESTETSGVDSYAATVVAVQSDSCSRQGQNEPLEDTPTSTSPNQHRRSVIAVDRQKTATPVSEFKPEVLCESFETCVVVATTTPTNDDDDARKNTAIDDVTRHGTPDADVTVSATKNSDENSDRKINRLNDVAGLEGGLDANAGDDGGRADGIMNIEIIKGSLGLGFCIEGGMGSATGDRPIAVKRLFRNDSLLGGLRVTDEIVAVNGCDFGKLSHFEAWKKLKALPDGTITVTIRRNLARNT